MVIFASSLPNNGQVVDVFVEVGLRRVDDLKVPVLVDRSDLLHDELAGHLAGAGRLLRAPLFPI